MIKFFLRIIYYTLYDLLKIVINIRSKYNFIILTPRLISILLNNVLIYEKKTKKIFFQKTRNLNDITTVFEIFSEESYNIQNFEIYENIKIYYNNVLKNNKKPLIIDCGSNIGSSTSYFSKIYNRSSIVLIEPDIKSFCFSKKNINYKELLEINSAINSSSTPINFLCDPNNSRASKVIEDKGMLVQSITVKKILHKFDLNKFEPFLIKIDIEGFEKNLFSSNYEWINDFKILIIEIHDWMLSGRHNSMNFINAIAETMKDNKKRDLLISGENLISVRIDE